MRADESWAGQGSKIKQTAPERDSDPLVQWNRIVANVTTLAKRDEAHFQAFPSFVVRRRFMSGQRSKSALTFQLLVCGC